MAWGIFTRLTVESAIRLLNYLFTPQWLTLLAKLQFFIFLFGFWVQNFLLKCKKDHKNHPYKIKENIKISNWKTAGAFLRMNQTI